MRVTLDEDIPRIKLMSVPTPVHCCVTGNLIERGEIALTITCENNNNAWIHPQNVSKLTKSLTNCPHSVENERMYLMESNYDIVYDYTTTGIPCAVCGTHTGHSTNMIGFSYNNQDPWIHRSCVDTFATTLKKWRNYSTQIFSRKV